ncbi:SpoIIE family protein phosphatase [Kineococcus terrestris]|uniref:SpoIIE family protein phosphatase n=1 Tax=Kineococcus terrestris TaxID=2044856 RepID=UPI0034DAFA9F
MTRTDAGTRAGTRAGAGVDFAAVFEDLPTPYLVLDRDLRVVAVNRARELATGHPRELVVGRPLFEVYPDNPDDPGSRGAGNLAASLRRVLETGEPDVMPLQRYDIAVADGAGFEVRWWSPVNAPVRGPDGEVAYLLHRVEDVTAWVRAQGGEPVSPYAERAVEQLEGDLHAQGRRLRDALTAEAAANRRLAGLARVAVHLTAASTLPELTETVVRGLDVLGADGGAVGVVTGDGLELTLTRSLRRWGGQRRTVPLDSPLPPSVAAATGSPVVVPDARAEAPLSPEVERVVAETGLVTWVALPLRAAERTLGSLTVGWREQQEFSDRDVELLSAFAAQCAQTLARIRAAEQERQVSEALQRSLLTAPYEPDHLQVGVRYLPAAEQARVGGDWYDCFIAPPGVTSLVVGDVAGHDRDAAATMGQVRNLLRGVAVALAGGPADVLAGLDRAMQQLGIGAIATAVLAQVEQTAAERAAGVRTLRWSSAGHPPPVLVEPGGAARLLTTPPDLLLGLAPDSPRADHGVRLEPGATVVLYTDGLVERRDAPLQQGLDWLRDFVAARHELTVEELCDALVAEVAAEHDDDVALLVLRTHPEDRPRPPEAGPVVLPPDPPEVRVGTAG